MLVLPAGEEKAGSTVHPPRVPRLALRASKRVVGVVCVSSGPEQLVRDAVALAGACARGTAPFVPTEVFAAAGLDAAREWSRDDPRVASCVAVFERAGWGAARGLETGAGRDYCWRCGDRSHRKRDCERAAGARPGENRPATTGGGRARRGGCAGGRAQAVTGRVTRWIGRTLCSAALPGYLVALVVVPAPVDGTVLTLHSPAKMTQK